MTETLQTPDAETSSETSQDVVAPNTTEDTQGPASKKKAPPPGTKSSFVYGPVNALIERTTIDGVPGSLFKAHDDRLQDVEYTGDGAFMADPDPADLHMLLCDTAEFTIGEETYRNTEIKLHFDQFDFRKPLRSSKIGTLTFDTAFGQDPKTGKRHATTFTGEAELLKWTPDVDGPKDDCPQAEFSLNFLGKPVKPLGGQILGPWLGDRQFYDVESKSGERTLGSAWKGSLSLFDGNHSMPPKHDGKVTGQLARYVSEGGDGGGKPPPTEPPAPLPLHPSSYRVFEAPQEVETRWGGWKADLQPDIPVETVDGLKVGTVFASTEDRLSESFNKMDGRFRPNVSGDSKSFIFYLNKPLYSQVSEAPGWQVHFIMSGFDPTQPYDSKSGGKMPEGYCAISGGDETEKRLYKVDFSVAEWTPDKHPVEKDCPQVNCKLVFNSRSSEPVTWSGGGQVSSRASMFDQLYQLDPSGRAEGPYLVDVSGWGWSEDPLGTAGSQRGLENCHGKLGEEIPIHNEGRTVELASESAGTPSMP